MHRRFGKLEPAHEKEKKFVCGYFQSIGEARGRRVSSVPPFRNELTIEKADREKISLTSFLVG